MSSDTGAKHPYEITHAFSVNGGHLAWSILAGKKRIENRSFKMRQGWYGLAVTLTARTGIMEDKWYRENYPTEYPGFAAFDNMRGKVVGACYISHSLPHTACALDPHADSSYWVKNIITKVLPFVSGIPVKGNLGAWPLSNLARDEVCVEVRRLLIGGNDVVRLTNAEKEYPEDPTWNGKTGKTYKGVCASSTAVSKARTLLSSKQETKSQASSICGKAKATVAKSVKSTGSCSKVGKNKALVTITPATQPSTESSQSKTPSDANGTRLAYAPKSDKASLHDIRFFFKTEHEII